MKTVIFITLIAFVTADTKYYNLENLGMSELVKNTDGLKIFLDCLLDRAPCSKLYNTYKVLSAESIEEKCNKCSPYQKHGYWEFLRGVFAKFPEDYIKFRQKYDPENKNFQDLECELSKYSISY